MYVINEQQRRFRAIYVRSVIQSIYDAGQFNLKDFVNCRVQCLVHGYHVVLCSWQRPPGGNSLYHILNYCGICCFETTLLLFTD